MKLFFVSAGLKRRIAAALTSILSAITTHPELAPLIPWVEGVAAAFGLTGIVHAAQTGNVKEKKLLSLTALLPLLIVAARNVPALAPYATIITLLSGLMSTGMLTLPVKEKATKKNSRS